MQHGVSRARRDIGANRDILAQRPQELELLRTLLRALGCVLIVLVLGFLALSAVYVYDYGFNPFLLWPEDLVGLLICAGLAWLIRPKTRPPRGATEVAKTFE